MATGCNADSCANICCPDKEIVMAGLKNFVILPRLAECGVWGAMIPALATQDKAKAVLCVACKLWSLFR